MPAVIVRSPLLAGSHFYVAPASFGGSDSNAGTKAKPWLTISKAGSSATPGSTVHVAAGSYVENVVINVSGASTQRIAFVSDQRWGARINGDPGDALTVNGDWVDLYGFDVTTPGGTVGIAIKGSHNNVVRCRIHDVGTTGPCQHGGGAIDVATTSGFYETYDCNVIGCLVFNTGQATCFPTYRIHGIYFAEPFGRGWNNLVYGVQGDGFSCWHGFTDGVVSQNTVFNCAGNGIIFGAGDVPPPGTLKPCDNCTVTNNIARDCGLIGIRNFGYDTSTIGLNSRIWNNISYNSTSGTNFDVTGAVYSPVNAITSDPLFVNYQADGSGDYHLQASSPGRNGGISVGSYWGDYLDVSRPQGAGYDMGIYEQA